jgi:hypothetical protein
MNNIVFWNVTCVLLVYGLLGGICCLCLQGRSVSKVKKFQVESSLPDYTASCLYSHSSENLKFRKEYVLFEILARKKLHYVGLVYFIWHTAG